MSAMTSSAAPPGDAPAGERGRYLTFALGTERFALDIMGIKEVIQFEGCTTVPMMPDFVRGVINLRGRVVPIIDLNARFGRGPSTTGKRSCIVIMEAGTDGEQQDVGVMVDAVQQVREIAADQVEPPPSFGVRVRTDFIHGMGKVDGRFVIILDAACVLSLDEMESLARLGAHAGDASQHAA